jgi:hypothetical protein
MKSIKACPHPLTSGKEAMKLDGIGKYIGAKIDEILEAEAANPTQSWAQDGVTQQNFPSAAPPSATNYPATVQDWLKEIGLSSYFDAFVEAGYDNLLVCEELEDSDLNHIGSIIKPGHRKTILLASKELKERKRRGPTSGSMVHLSSSAHIVRSAPPLSTNSSQELDNSRNTSEESESSDMVFDLTSTLPSNTSATSKTSSTTTATKTSKAAKTRTKTQSLPKVTDKFIREHSNLDEIARGQRYFTENKVTSVELSDLSPIIHAMVQPSIMKIYSVTFYLNTSAAKPQISSAICSCYEIQTQDLEENDSNGWCKHVS